MRAAECRRWEGQGGVAPPRPTIAGVQDLIDRVVRRDLRSRRVTPSVSMMAWARKESIFWRLVAKSSSAAKRGASDFSGV